MNLVRNSVLLKYWNEPEKVCHYTIPEWELFFRQARSARLAGQWAYRLAQQEDFDQIPESAKMALDAAWTFSEHHQRALLWEIRQVEKVIQPIECTKILLKGAAYMYQDMEFAQGRLVSDLDVLAPKNYIEPIEKTLLDNGWESGKYDPYDQRYYRQWMHEIPPMVNLQRGATIDVHHNILPETSRRRLDPAPLFDSAVKLPVPDSIRNENPWAPEFSQWRSLQDVDMVIHAAVHAFQEGEIDGSLRDVVDIDGLLRLFTRRSSDFWDRLIDRAQLLGQARPLYYAIHYSREILDTPIPEEMKKTIQKMGPGSFARSFMDAAVFRALAPPTFHLRPLSARASSFFLYARSHYGRMPLNLLIPHLWHKAFPKDKIPQPDNDGQPMG